MTAASLACLISPIYLMVQLCSANALAQATGFYMCADDSGNFALCSGEIPENLLPDEPATTIPDGRGCGAPGIKSAVLHTYCHNGREIVIWTDFEQEFLASFGTANLNRRQVTDSDHNQVLLGFRRRMVTGFLQGHSYVNYHFEIIGDAGGTGVINDSLFSLEDGDLFLVATKGPAIEIKQIAYNLAYTRSEDIKWLAIEHPEISSFFEEFLGELLYQSNPEEAFGWLSLAADQQCLNAALMIVKCTQRVMVQGKIQG